MTINILTVVTKIKSVAGEETVLIIGNDRTASLFIADKPVAKTVLDDLATRFLEEVARHLSAMERTPVFPCLPPQEGHVAFGVLTSTGAFTTGAPQKELTGHGPPLSPLYDAAQKIITQLRTNAQDESAAP